MTFRRKIPRRRRDLSPASKIQNEINDLDRQERKLQVEQLDVFSHVETPEGSEDEWDPGEPIAHPPKSQGAGRLLENILAAEPFPTRDTEFSELYSYKAYKENVGKKMKKMIRTAKREDFEVAYQDERFWRILQVVKDTYPDDGGRPHLNELVAFFCYYDKSGDKEEEDDEDSDYDDDDEDDDDDDDSDELAKRKKLAEDAPDAAPDAAPI